MVVGRACLAADVLAPQHLGRRAGTAQHHVAQHRNDLVSDAIVDGARRHHHVCRRCLDVFRLALVGFLDGRRGAAAWTEVEAIDVRGRGGCRRNHLAGGAEVAVGACGGRLLLEKHGAVAVAHFIDEPRRHQEAAVGENRETARHRKRRQ